MNKKREGQETQQIGGQLGNALNRLKASIDAKAKTKSEMFGPIISSRLEDAEIPGVVVEMSREDAEAWGAFEEDALSEQDAIESMWDNDPLAPSGGWANGHERRLAYLREHHRILSEQIVTINRDLARLTATGSHEASEVAPLRQRLREAQAHRNTIEADIQAEAKALKALERRLATVPRGPSEGQGGLVKVRHPNRDFFLADMFDYALKDDGASMEAPIFTLATRPDLSIWEWRSKDGDKYVKVTPSVLGRATQHDKDILIYIVSQLVEGLNRDRADAKNRTVRFTVYDFLVTTNRQTSGQGYKLLHEGFERLRGTSITTDIRTGGTRVREGFGIIDRWKIIEKSPTDERMIAVEVTLSEWLYNAVQAFEVLTIHQDYFRLRKPLARRLYELARKHCGHQTQWVIGLELLQEKAGSKSTLKEFRRAVRVIQDDDSLPEYRFILSSDDKVTFYTRDQRRLVRGLARRQG